jgi:hypothetical protein
MQRNAFENKLHAPNIMQHSQRLMSSYRICWAAAKEMNSTALILGPCVCWHNNNLGWWCALYYRLCCWGNSPLVREKAHRKSTGNFWIEVFVYLSDLKVWCTPSLPNPNPQQDVKRRTIPTRQTHWRHVLPVHNGRYHRRRPELWWVQFCVGANDVRCISAAYVLI